MKKKLVVKFLVALLIVLEVVVGAFALVGCDDSEDPNDNVTSEIGNNTNDNKEEEKDDVTNDKNEGASSDDDQNNTDEDDVIIDGGNDNDDENVEVTPHTHSWSKYYTTDGTHHWRKCEGCDEKEEYDQHVLTYSPSCDVCSLEFEPTAGVMYDLSADGTYAEVIGYSGADTVVIIADEYNGLPVEKIYNEAFEDSAISAIVFPDTLTEIGASAFYNCYNLKSLYIPRSVTIIGKSAFNNCITLASIEMPYVYGECFGYIFGASRYYDNDIYVPSSLESVTISAGTDFNSTLFTYCKNIKELNLAESINNIVFDTRHLPGLPVAEYENCNYVRIGDNPYAVLIGVTNKNYSTYNVNENTRVIGAEAFKDCARLTTLVIPDGVTNIGEGALSGCTSLKEITLPFVGTNYSNHFGSLFSATTSQYPYKHHEVKYEYGDKVYYYYTIPNSIETVTVNGDIGVGAFATYNGYGVGIDKIIISDVTTTIGRDAFYNCDSLTNIEIPDSVISIGSGAFSGCDSLAYNEYDNAYYLGNDNNPYLWLFYAKDESISSCSIHRDTKSIYDGAFSGCGSLTSVEIPDSVTSIGDYAFSGCTSLTSVEIPDSVTSIGWEAFTSCDSLTSVYISDIASWCKIEFDSIYSNPLTYAEKLYLNGELVTELSIPDGITSIGAYAFCGCTSLTSVEIPDGVTSIGEYAFRGCTSLTSVEIPDSVTSIGSYAFYNCVSLTSVYIPESVDVIEYNAFSYCGDVKFYCEATSQPNGWDYNWHYNTNSTVYWGYNSNDD